MKQIVSAFLAAFIFGLGLAISGMTRPSKVIGFLDVFGNWDPSLMFVMVDAIGVHFFAYRFIKGLKAPYYSSEVFVPVRKDIDFRLIVGSSLFGVGWGLAGYCPGPGITSIASGEQSSLLFVVSLFVGIVLFHITDPIFEKTVGRYIRKKAR